MEKSDKPKEPKIDESEAIASFNEKFKTLRQEIHKIVIGQEQVIDRLLIALFSQGHALLIGVPGLAKTLLVKTLAGVLGWDFKRIQFTPDMMPSDITGTEILQTDSNTGTRYMKFVHGPVFSNLILADEINRAPPKTQAALLESMQEYTVTAAGQTYPLNKPFMVVATQNPIEQEGTYPLPEAQLDRFMFNIEVDYPLHDDEIGIVDETTTHDPNAINVILTKEDVIACQQFVRRIPVSKHVLTYAVDLATASRPSPTSDPYINEYVEWGAGVRASQYLILGAKSLALLRNLPAPSCKEVRDVALPVLGHRIIRNYKAAGKGITTNMIIQALLKSVKESDYTLKDGKKDVQVRKTRDLTGNSSEKISAGDRISLALNKIRSSPKKENI
ncbi:MAG: AAA family ATPase [Sedimentisphaerales bacterium]|nr:AAA family ATPase [Sedimentisphaerales bacterium]